MNIDYQLIGQRIASHRKKKYITQECLAEHLDVSTAFISKIERGKTQLSLERFVQICQFLGIDPTELLYGSVPETSSYMLPELSVLLDDCPREALPLVKVLIEDVIKYHKSVHKKC